MVEKELNQGELLRHFLSDLFLVQTWLDLHLLLQYLYFYWRKLSTSSNTAY